MTEFLDDSQETTDGSSDLQITGKQSFESANFRQYARHEWNDAFKGMKSLLKDEDLMQRFPTQSRTLLRGAFSNFELLELELKRRLPMAAEEWQAGKWRDLAERTLRSSQRTELKRLQNILRGLVPSDNTITEGALQQLILAYNRLALFFTAVHAMNEEYLLLVWDKNRDNGYREFQEVAIWETPLAQSSFPSSTSQTFSEAEPASIVSTVFSRPTLDLSAIYSLATSENG